MVPKLSMVSILTDLQAKLSGEMYQEKLATKGLRRLVSTRALCRCPAYSAGALKVALTFQGLWPALSGLVAPPSSQASRPHSESSAVKQGRETEVSIASASTIQDAC